MIVKILHKYRLFLIIPVVFIIGGIVGYMLNQSNWLSLKEEFHQDRAGGYTFINPLLECEYSTDATFRMIRPFEEKIENLVKKEVNQNRASHISVYFRLLNDGRWFGISEDELFLGGSLFKLPVLMAYLKYAETNPGIFEEKVKVEVSEDFNATRYFSSTKSIKNGETHTVLDLLIALIVSSDNNASAALFYKLPRETMDRVYTDLGLSIPSFTPGKDSISVRNYASFFRILYNATYLTKNYSEMALDMLADSQFDQGLTKGLPKEISVAHKFGERTIGNERQLHDCGIVYFPKTPYILCVLTRGDDFVELSNVISSISSAVYTELKSQFVR